MKYHLTYGDLCASPTSCCVYINEWAYPCGCGYEYRKILNLHDIRCLRIAFKKFHHFRFQTKIHNEYN